MSYTCVASRTPSRLGRTRSKPNRRILSCALAATGALSPIPNYKTNPPGKSRPSTLTTPRLSFCTLPPFG
jgi:hypothetical protein